MLTKMRGAVVLVVAVLVAAPAVLAQSSPVTAYGGQAGAVQGQLGAQAGGTLPFTGSDLTVLAVVAAMLLVGGIVLRRVVRSGR